MKIHTIATVLALFLTISVIAGTTVPQLSGMQPVATTDEGWKFQFDVYGWVEALDGDISARGLAVPVDLDFGDVLDNLDVAAMGAFSASRGPWSIYLDVSYAELSGNSSGARTYSRLNVEQLIAHGIVAYTVFDEAASTVQVYGGVRVNSFDADFNLIGVRRAAAATGSQTWVDPIVGLRVSKALPNDFFFRALGDVGGFGVESDLTWQAMALLGYRLGENTSILVGYRGIGTDYSKGTFSYDVISHGPILGLECQF